MPNPYAPPDPSRPRPQRPVAPAGAPLAAPPQRPPADEQGTVRAVRTARTAFQLLLAGIVVALLPAPWSVAAIAFSAASLVVAIRSLQQASRARAVGQVPLLAMIVAGAAAVGLLIGAGSVALLPTRIAYQDCLSSALTVQATTACTDAYNQRITDLTKRLSATR